eukprot:Hpha_TRINITY_DN22493_c0_g1::TRINITY_DN22493_c0_g1_i1::g.94999::m.94999
MALNVLISLGDACGGETIGEGQVAKCLEASTDGAAVREFALSHPPRYQRLLHSLVAALNTEGAVKRKTSALLCLANFGKQKPARSDLFDAVKHIDFQFEKTLTEKEEAHNSFGSALGKLHETMLVLLMRMDNYRLRGGELLEFAHGNVPFAVQIAIGVLKVQSYEPEILANTAGLLSDLSNPSAFVSVSEGAAVTEHSCKEFRDRVDALIVCVMKHNLLTQLCASIWRYLAPSLQGGAATAAQVGVHAAVQRLATMVVNLYSFSSLGASSVSFRQSILVSTDIGRVILPGYIATCLAQIDKCVDVQESKIVHPPPGVAVAGIVHALRVLSFAGFHVGQHCVPVRERNTWTIYLLRLPPDFIQHNSNLYAWLLHCNVNIDAFAGESHLPKGVTLDDSCRSATILRALSEFCASSTKDMLAKVWALLGRHSSQVPLARDNLSFNILSNLVDTALRPDVPESAQRLDDSTLAVVTEELDRHISNLEDARADLSSLREELRALNVERKAPPVAADLRLLGDLPPLDAGSPSKQPPPPETLAHATFSPLRSNHIPSIGEQTTHLWGQGGADSSVPEEFRCALNGHLLKQPMRTPKGVVYEKLTIETWLKQTGSRDPLSGEPLTLDQLQPDEELTNRIVDWQIGQTMDKPVKDDDDEDIYNF